MLQVRRDLHAALGSAVLLATPQKGIFDDSVIQQRSLVATVHWHKARNAAQVVHMLSAVKGMSQASRNSQATAGGADIVLTYMLQCQFDDDVEGDELM
jgi:hypothetical protein